MKKLVIVLSLGICLNIAAQSPTAQQKKEMEEQLKEQEKAHEAFLKELEAKRDMLEKILPKYRAECEKSTPGPYHNGRHDKICLQYCKLSQKYLDALNKIEEIKHVFSIDEKNEMRKAAIMEQAEQQMQKQKEQKASPSSYVTQLKTQQRAGL